MKIAMSANDPYRTLGVRAGVSDAELRKAYRRLVQLHHPDHNGGSPESARRFEEIQDAYARIKRVRETPSRAEAAQANVTTDPAVDARLANLERELREAQLARERAAREAREARAARDRATQAAREAAAPGDVRSASDEELGYITTDDNFTQILADARSELSERFSRAREHPVVRRVSDLIDELDEFASRGDGERPAPRRKP